MGIAVGGLASGIDSESIISQLMALEEQRIFQIQRRIAVEETKKAAYDDLIGRVDSLRRASSKFSDDGIFGELQVTSSDSSVLTASTRPSASPGSYNIEVKQIATSHRIAAQGFVDKSGTGIAAEDGKFIFRVGEGSDIEFDIDDSTSLEGFANLINDSNQGVSAAIVNDGSGSNPHRLVLTASKAGSEGEITIIQNDSTLDFSNKQIEEALADEDNSEDYEGTVSSGGNYTGEDNTSFLIDVIAEGAADGTAKFRYSTDGGLTFQDNNGLGFDVTSAGPIALADGVTVSFEDNGTLREGDQFSIDVFNPELRRPTDAIMVVNGITIRKSSNAVSDVFEGITFNLQSADPGKTVNLSVARDAGTVEETLTGFIGAYNGVVGFLRSQFAYDPADGGRAPPLNGDSAARQVERDIKRIVSSRMDGLSGGSVSSLSELGLESNEKTGILSFNPIRLSELMNKDPTDVERVLTRFGERLSGTLKFARRTGKSQPGTYDVTVTQARTRAKVTGGAPAEVLANNEQLTFSYNRRAQNNGNPSIFTVDFLAGDAPAAQIVKLNEKFDERGFAMNAFLEADGAITVRSTEYGDDYALTVQSNLGIGAGTSQFGLAERASTGTDLRGLIGGAAADTVSGDRLRGGKGFRTEGIEIIAPNDASGNIGQVRIVDGLAEKLPSIIDGLTGGNGILRSRAAGVNTRISSMEDDILRQQRRMEAQEERLRRQFTNMEVTMGKLDALGQYVTQQMEAMANMNKKK